MLLITNDNKKVIWNVIDNKWKVILYNKWNVIDNKWNVKLITNEM